MAQFEKIKEEENKKRVIFVNYQMAEAIKLLDEYDVSNPFERKFNKKRLKE